MSLSCGTVTPDCALGFAFGLRRLAAAFTVGRPAAFRILRHPEPASSAGEVLFSIARFLCDESLCRFSLLCKLCALCVSLLPAPALLAPATTVIGPPRVHSNSLSARALALFSLSDLTKMDTLFPLAEISCHFLLWPRCLWHPMDCSPLALLRGVRCRPGVPSQPAPIARE